MKMLKLLRRAADRRRQTDGDYAWLFYPYTGDELVSIGCETTGIDTRRAELVSLAAVKIRGDRVLTSDSLDLRLSRPASPSGDSIRIHDLRGVDLLTEHDLERDGETVGSALASFLDFIGNRPLVGWHLGFDLAIINRELRPRFGFDLPNAGIDVTQAYARQLRRSHLEIEPRLCFERVAEALGVPVMGSRTALGGAVTTALMYLRLERGAILAKRSS